MLSGEPHFSFVVFDVLEDIDVNHRVVHLLFAQIRQGSHLNLTALREKPPADAGLKRTREFWVRLQADPVFLVLAALRSHRRPDTRPYL